MISCLCLLLPYPLPKTGCDETELPLLHECGCGGLCDQCCHHGSKAWLEASTTGVVITYSNTVTSSLHHINIVMHYIIPTLFHITSSLCHTNILFHITSSCHADCNVIMLSLHHPSCPLHMQYLFNPETGLFRHHKHHISKDRRWLSTISYESGEMVYPRSIEDAAPSFKVRVSPPLPPSLSWPVVV